MDTGKAEGVKGTYLYTRQLVDKEIETLIQLSESLVLGNKRKVWAYDAVNLELIRGVPFSSIHEAANYFNVNYRTISRHLDTKKATTQNKTLVYFFKKELSLEIRDELLKSPSKANMDRTEIWVYKVDSNGDLTLMSNQPFKTKR